MATKYKIEKAKVNKNLIGDEVTVSKVKPKGGRGGNGGGRNPKPPRITLADVLKEMREGFARQEKFNRSVTKQFKAHGWTK